MPRSCPVRGTISRSRVERAMSVFLYSGVDPLSQRRCEALRDCCGCLATHYIGDRGTGVHRHRFDVAGSVFRRLCVAVAVDRSSFASCDGVAFSRPGTFRGPSRLLPLVKRHVPDHAMGCVGPAAVECGRQGCISRFRIDQLFDVLGVYVCLVRSKKRRPPGQGVCPAARTCAAAAALPIPPAATSGNATAAPTFLTSSTMGVCPCT